LFAFAAALLVADTINIAADLAGMADAAAMLSGIKSYWFVLAFALLISWATVRLQYRQIANVLKWLVLVLFAYPITAFIVGADWGTVLRDTLIPSMPRTRNEWATLVAILGTTISPYLFFWQASEEVEEEKSPGQSTLALRKGATVEELELRNIDVGVGAFFSNMVMFFIILTTAITLHKHGITNIETSRQAAESSSDCDLVGMDSAAMTAVTNARTIIRCRFIPEGPLLDWSARHTAGPAGQATRNCDSAIRLGDRIVPPLLRIAISGTGHVSNNLRRPFLYPQKYLQSKDIEVWSHLLGAASESLEAAAPAPF
jgi:hypothetical protein